MGYYDTIASGYNELYGAEQSSKIAIIKQNLCINPNHILLDVGCGTGLSMAGFGCKVIGIDPSLGLLLQNKNHGRIICACAEYLPFKDNSFDIVISVTAMQNFTDLNKSLSEILRVGKMQFALTILKKSSKAHIATNLIQATFSHCKIIESDKDIIYFCQK